MDFTNINDPAGVKALLDQLRTSQAWQELKSETSQSAPTSVSSHTNLSGYPNVAHSSSSAPEVESSPVISDHISSLLSRLQSSDGVGSSSATGPQASDAVPQHDNVIHRTSHVAIHASSSNANDPRSLNFNQALPVIARLSEDPAFMDKLEKLQDDQARLERNLWEERTRIIKAHQERVRVTQAKASIIGIGLSQKDAKMLQTSLEEELKGFDLEQVLPAWDALFTKQQTALEALGVPSMFATAITTDRERQRRIVRVLEGLADPSEEEMKLYAADRSHAAML